MFDDRRWYVASGNALELLEMVQRLDVALRGVDPLYSTSELAAEVEHLVHKCTPNDSEEN